MGLCVWKGNPYKSYHIMKALIALVFFLMLCRGCTTQKYEDIPRVYGYNSAVFKSWLLFDSLDTYYAPPRLSRAGYLRRLRIKRGLKITEKELEREAPHMSSYICSKEGEGAGICSLMHVETRLKTTDRDPLHMPWAIDYSHDINAFTESLDLEQLAKACYEGGAGEIWFIPGRRDILEDEYTGEMFGKFRTGLAQRRWVGWQPARFVTPNDLDLSVLMDNIWLLWQLARDGWVEIANDGTWNWTQKAKHMKNSSKETTLATLSPELRKRFAILDLIRGWEGELPAIPCTVRPTCERQRFEDDELRLMRQDEGCLYRHFVYDTLFIAPKHRDFGVYNGNELHIGEKKYIAMQKDPEYKGTSAIAQYEDFAVSNGIQTFCSIRYREEPCRERRARLIYSVR